MGFTIIRHNVLSQTHQGVTRLFCYKGSSRDAQISPTQPLYYHQSSIVVSITVPAQSQSLVGLRFAHWITLFSRDISMLPGSTWKENALRLMQQDCFQERHRIQAVARSAQEVLFCQGSNVPEIEGEKSFHWSITHYFEEGLMMNQCYCVIWNCIRGGRANLTVNGAAWMRDHLWRREYSCCSTLN